MNKIFILCLLLSLVGFSRLSAQTDSTSVASESAEDEEKLIRELSFVPMPVLAANPAMGFMYGLAPSASWMMGDDASTHRSSLVSSIIYTTKKQFLFFIKTNIFLKDDSWNLMGDWRYFATSQPTYGLGTGPSSNTLASNGFEYDDGSYSKGINEAQMMDFNYLRFHETALKRVGDTRFFAGLGYHLDYHYNIDDKLLGLGNDGIIDAGDTVTSHYAYSTYYGFDPESYLLSGISINGLFDSRNNMINPTDGRYGFISFHINPTFFGSDKNSTSLWLEYRDYFRMSQKRPRHLIGVWTYANFVTSGEVPYLDLPAIGWDQFGRSGRAYPQGRFRGQSIAYAEAEYRFPLMVNSDLIGGVIFANATTATNEDTDLNLFEYVDPGVGLGLRVMINKKSQTNISLDYAWGRYGAQGFYLNVNETF
ncbi:outer membrane protein assembly factor [Reichenbachiella carrageenanivorans]|uniref:Outer membrane protein assembly factor n=1 Tax=Reichenbachiella carrageenanivorans TaxID=2979869 RepID=A0ABY6CZD9_9BACT|nr:outer membrane protein assembly factor [Reichenbachiella carrageenanivorans]UXX78784.1 outer membrane protein assembly factor [Reichenbachiella carrageenanivorans]